MNHLRLRTSVGQIAVSWKHTGLLSSIDWLAGGAHSGSENKIEGTWTGNLPSFVIRLIDLLQGYFESGEPIEDVPWDEIDMGAWSDFQRDTYRAIAVIPHGETRTYAWVATRVGRPAASRAVGQALRKNPFPVLIPCHRVVAANTLGGFMGQSEPDQPAIQLKRKLIQLEETYRNPEFPFIRRCEGGTPSRP